VKARIIATLSPDKERYKEFKKNLCSTFYLPCPSEVQIRLMGIVYRNILGTFASDKDIAERVQDMGPFIRAALISDSSERADFIQERNSNIVELIASGFKGLRDAVHIEYHTNEVREGLSHRLAKYVVDYSEPNLWIRYRKRDFAISSDMVRIRIIQEILAANIAVIREHLVKANNTVIDFHYFHAKSLERIFMHYVMSDSGLTWKDRELRQDGDQSTSENDWTRKHIKLVRLAETAIPFEDMKENVLYYPNDSKFPLVDLYWKESKNLLVAVQATRSIKHPKSPNVYTKFLNKLSILPSCTAICVEMYYLVLPFTKALFEQEKYPPSHLFSSVKSLDYSQWASRIQFRAILPPPTFEAAYQEYVVKSLLSD
jgi:hypothetical protein